MKIKKYTALISMFIFVSLFFISSCKTNLGSTTEESVYDYGDITYTIVSNSTFKQKVDIKVSEVEIDDSFKNNLSEKLSGIKFTKPNFIGYSNNIKSTNESLDKERLTQKAIEKLKELNLYPQYEVRQEVSVSVRGQLLNSNSDSEFPISNLFILLRPVYREIPIIKENNDGISIGLSGNGEIESLSFYNIDVQTTPKLGKVELLPVEKIIEKFDEAAQKKISYKEGQLKNLKCTPIYYFYEDKCIPVWCIGEEDDLTNPSYVNAITGEVIMIGFK